MININMIENLKLRGLKEFRHPLNNNLLCKANWKWHIEIQDKKTRQIMYIWPTRKHNDIGLKGIEFQNLSKDFKCFGCNRLLGRGLWIRMNVEIKCTHCKEVCGYSMQNLHDSSLKTLPLIAKEKILNKIKSLTF